jgi:hypothetical protein
MVPEHSKIFYERRYKMKKSFLIFLTAVCISVLSVSSAFAGNDLYYGGLRDTLDSIPLQPMQATGDQELDNLLNSLIPQIISDDMDTHDKLRACYDYIINHTEYGADSHCGDSYDMAYGVLADGIGVCDQYSAAFAVMARKIGLPMCTVGGETHKSDGSFTPHAWCQMDYNGTTYVFDPEVEDVIAGSNGGIMYIRFGGTSDQLAGKYHYTTLVDDFTHTRTANGTGSSSYSSDGTTYKIDEDTLRKLVEQEGGTFVVYNQ